MNLVFLTVLGSKEDQVKRPFLSDYIYQTWLPQSGYKLAAPLEIEHERQLLVPIEMDG